MILDKQSLEDVFGHPDDEDEDEGDKEEEKDQSRLKSYSDGAWFTGQADDEDRGRAICARCGR